MTGVETIPKNTLVKNPFNDNAYYIKTPGIKPSQHNEIVSALMLLIV